MGEMAQLIINGDMCACGCILETEGQGFPRACCKSCSKDFDCPIEKKHKKYFNP